MIKYWVICCVATILLITPYQIESRSLKRPLDQSIPSITVMPSDPTIAHSWYSCKTRKKYRKTDTHKLRSPYLRVNPIIKGFDDVFFEKYYLPQNESIEFRNKQGSVNNKILEQLAETIVAEIKAGQRKFTHFKILKDSDFNYKKLSGLLVVKYNDYPFVLKLSIEHPHTMIQPYTKSFAAKFIFIFGGNIRHLSNFTRITNLEDIKKRLCYNPYYIENIDFPRKWYWKPKQNYNLEITWHKTPYLDEQTFKIPSLYATISDYIDIDTTYPQQELNRIAMKIATDVEFRIDPHAGNLVVEKGSTKYTMLDTENFRIMTGMNHTMSARKYISWFFELSMSCLKVYSGRTRQERIQQCFRIID